VPRSSASFVELGQEGVYQGHDGTRQYLSNLDDAWEIVRADVDDGIGIGEVAILVGHDPNSIGANGSGAVSSPAHPAPRSPGYPSGDPRFRA
jgi:hypothetical protein